MLRNTLTGLDESPYTDAVVDLGICLARRNRSTLVGLGIVDEPTICKPEAVGSLSGMVLQRVEKRNPRMLVMGAHGRSRLSEFLFGSVTRAVLRKSKTLLFMHH